MSSPPPSSSTPTSPSPPPPSTAPPPPPPPPVVAAVPRKFPAPCWTQDETLALIASYRDKWYSLRRRNLRTADWETVAADVTRRCPPPPSSSPKTSAQCRHKMEKLRKRYRTEKQRLLSLPINHHNRLFSPASSWVFFDLMDSMEAGTDPATHNHNHNHNPNPPMAHINPNPSPNAVFVKAVVANTNPNPNPNPNPPVDSKPDLGKYLDEILTGGPIKIRVKNHRRFEEQDNYSGGARNMIQSGPPAGYKRVYPGEEMEEEMLGKRVLNNNGRRKKEERRDSVAEMVSSIKMLGEGLVRMEKMKMDMMREIERMRMEMEMKRSEVILESQQLIVNAFVEGMKKNKKQKLMEVE